MKILQNNKRVMEIIGMCALADGSDIRLKVSQMANAAVLLILFLLVEWFSMLYCLEHYRIGDIANNLFAVIQVIGDAPTIACFISLMYQKKSVREYFERLQKIVDERNR